ncbi:MAG: S-methyl-5'-thioadenosine phosphorylase [Afipia sp.]
MTILGVLGGSGVYDIAGLENPTWRRVASPFGETSDEFLFGTLDGLEVVFVPRHGRGHRHSPSSINYRANIDALKRSGVTDLVSISACGSLCEDLPPGHFILVDQFVDRTIARPSSFFGEGMVAHVSMAHPTCDRLSNIAYQCAVEAAIPVRRKGTYLAIEGPQFSSLAESRIYRSWGCDVIGMTNMPEAKLAREAEMCFLTVAMVTDFDCWHPDHAHVQVADVIRVLNENAEKAKQLIRLLAPRLRDDRPTPCPHGCDRTLDVALVTAPGTRDPKVLAGLDAIAGRVLG